MTPLPHTHSCFVCGESNAHGLQLRFHSDGRTVHTRFTPAAEHIGFKGVTHGGLLATVLDEIMVWAVAVASRRFAYCAEMTVRFQRPARPGEELTATAELVADGRGKIFEARGELRSPGGEVVATATGKYLPIPEAEVAGMLTELVGDRSLLA
jgi:uncharacterized protein (TIGR00369 family)